MKGFSVDYTFKKKSKQEKKKWSCPFIYFQITQNLSISFLGKELHFKNENYWFGVTTPTYDFLLGTFKNQKKVEKSATARNLEKRNEYKNNPLDF